MPTTEMITVSGTVYIYGSSERLAGAVIKATSSKGVTELAMSDDDGDFSFAKLLVGEWSFVALSEHCHASKPFTLTLRDNKSDMRFNLLRRMGTRDEYWGTAFFLLLIIAFMALAVVWAALHLVLPQGRMAANGGVLWQQEPWTYLEVLCWALAGVLVNKIIEVGYYLRWKRFYREGIVMHLSNILTVPILALVALFVLSLVNLQITISGSNELTLNLANPQVLVAVSFLVGARPWSLWGFIQTTADRVVGEGKKKG